MSSRGVHCLSPTEPPPASSTVTAWLFKLLPPACTVRAPLNWNQCKLSGLAVLIKRTPSRGLAEDLRTVWMPNELVHAPTLGKWHETDNRMSAAEERWHCTAWVMNGSELLMKPHLASPSLYCLQEQKLFAASSDSSNPQEGGESRTLTNVGHNEVEALIPVTCSFVFTQSI